MDVLVNKYRWALAPILGLFLSLSALACGDEGNMAPKIPVTCVQLTCGHGQCVEGTPERPDAICACDEGYEGEHCEACAEGFSPKSDSSGICILDCKAGEQDNDLDGICKPTCEASGLECGQHATCTDASGEATCACDEGMQDKDGDGNCSEACSPDKCGQNATCGDETGIAVCTCDKGFAMKEGACVEVNHHWTIMVYLDGDNDLEDFAKADLQEMKSMTATEGINLIVLADMRKSKDTKLYQVVGGQVNQIDQVAADAFIFDNNEAAMNDWQTLKRFGEWAVEAYPANAYALFLWNHGGGWKDKNAQNRCTGAPFFRDFAMDEHSPLDENVGIELSGGDFTKALKAITAKTGQKIDLVGFDACLMGMYEVATSCQEDADYLVASEESEPGDGWFYEGFLKKLVAKPQMSPSELGKSIVDAYNNSSDYSVTLSLVDLSQMGDVHAKLSEFASSLTSDLATSSLATKVKKHRNDTQSFDYPEHVDLMDFAKRIASDTSMPQATRDNATALINALNVAIVYNKTNNYTEYDYWWGTEEYNYDNAYGMAIFFPTSVNGLEDTYTRTDWLLYQRASWASLSTWDEFIGKFIPGRSGR